MEFSENIYDRIRLLELDTRNNFMAWLRGGYSPWSYMGMFPTDPSGARAYKKRFGENNTAKPTFATADVTIPGINDLAYRYGILYDSKQSDITTGALNKVHDIINTSPEYKFNKSLNVKPVLTGGGVKQSSEGRQIDVGGIMASGFNFLGDSIGSFLYNTDSSDMIADAGTSTAYRSGIGYNSYNNIDTNLYKRDLNRSNTTNMLKTTAGGAAIGTQIAPGWGTAIGALGGLIVGGIGSLVRSSKAKREMEEALNQVLRSNMVASNRANTIGMNNDWNSNHMNTYNLVLHGAYGLDRFNAMVAPGEIKIDGNGNGKLETGGINGIDSIPEYLNSQDSVLSKDLGYAYEALPALMYQQYLKSIANKNKGLSRNVANNVIRAEMNKTKQHLLSIADKQAADRANGYIPQGDNVHAAFGWDNLAVQGGAALFGLANYINDRGQKVKKANTFVENPYSLGALNMLNSLSPVGYNHIYRSTADTENRAINAINRSGGLSSSQKMAGYTTVASNSLRNLYNALTDRLNVYNALKAQYANAALQAGAQYAQNRMAANQFDLDYYSKAKAAYNNLWRTDFNNIYSPLAQFVADEDTRRRGDYMLDIYAAEAANKGAKIKPRKNSD